MKAILILVAAVFLFVPTAQGSSPGQYGTCAPILTTQNIGGLITAGTIEYCIYVPSIVHSSLGNDDTVRLTAVVSGPAGTNVVFAYLTNLINGCSISTITQTDTVGTFAAMSSAHWNLDITDNANQCTGAIKITVSAGLIPSPVFSAWLPFMIQTETVEVDNLNRLCLFSAVNTTCAQPVLTIQDDSNGWVIHQDEACGATIPCLTNQTLQIGNVSQNNTVAGDVGETVKAWIPLLIAFAVLALATMRAKPNYLAVIIAGAFFVYAAIFCPFNETTVKLMVALFGLYNALLGSLELYGDKRSIAMEE
jgi:hypothetical protein